MLVDDDRRRHEHVERVGLGIECSAYRLDERRSDIRHLPGPARLNKHRHPGDRLQTRLVERLPKEIVGMLEWGHKAAFLDAESRKVLCLQRRCEIISQARKMTRSFRRHDKEAHDLDRTLLDGIGGKDRPLLSGDAEYLRKIRVGVTARK